MEIDGTGGASPAVARLIYRTGTLAAWGYVVFALLGDVRLAGIHVGAGLQLLLFLAGLGVLWRLLRPGPGLMVNAGLSLVATVTTLLVIDMGYTIWANGESNRSRVAISEAVREEDPHVWHGEVMPEPYWPTRKRFFVYKPGSRTAATTYGEFYHSSMLRSPVLVDSVLELRPVSYAIGPHGVRDTLPLAGSRIFALGDSFVFGFATDDPLTWPRLLAKGLGEPVYNLGVSSTGPRPQLMLLQHLFASHPDSMHVRQLLWMIYEGNDLENDYGEERLPHELEPGTPMLEGTLLQAFTSLPGRLRKQSVLRRALRGELRYTLRNSGAAHDVHWRIDGVTLPVPLYHSGRWGYRLFSQADVERAAATADYVRHHPNLPLLERTFEEMRDLAAKHRFEVVVIVAPSDARLYGRAFDDFPRPSDEPRFADHVLALAVRLGFVTIDLVRGMQPYAERELLYYRDDHHWNARGNAVAAELIRTALPVATPSRTQVRAAP